MALDESIDACHQQPIGSSNIAPTDAAQGREQKGHPPQATPNELVSRSAGSWLDKWLKSIEAGAPGMITTLVVKPSMAGGFEAAQDITLWAERKGMQVMPCNATQA